MAAQQAALTASTAAKAASQSLVWLFTALQRLSSPQQRRAGKTTCRFDAQVKRDGQRCKRPARKKRVQVLARLAVPHGDNVTRGKVRLRRATRKLCRHRLARLRTLACERVEEQERTGAEVLCMHSTAGRHRTDNLTRRLHVYCSCCCSRISTGSHWKCLKKRTLGTNRKGARNCARRHNQHAVRATQMNPGACRRRRRQSLQCRQSWCLKGSARAL